MIYLLLGELVGRTAANPTRLDPSDILSDLGASLKREWVRVKRGE
jgi:hypothetical protein